MLAVSKLPLSLTCPFSRLMENESTGTRLERHTFYVETKDFIHGFTQKLVRLPR